MGAEGLSCVAFLSFSSLLGLIVYLKQTMYHMLSEECNCKVQVWFTLCVITYKSIL